MTLYITSRYHGIHKIQTSYVLTYCKHAVNSIICAFENS